MDELLGGAWPLSFLIAFTLTIPSIWNGFPTILAKLNFWICKGIFKYYQLLEASYISPS